GLRSQQRSANAEAIGHLTRGLALLATLPESPERDARELEFLNPLGAAYQSARGYAAPETGSVFRRAREVCERIGQPVLLFSTLWGTYAWQVVRGDLRLAVDTVVEAMDLAERLDDPGMRMEASLLRGITLLYRGDFAGSRAHCVDNHDDRDRIRFWSGLTGHDSGVLHRCFLSLALWHLGCPDQALKINRQAVELARAIGPSFTVILALHHQNWLQLNCGLAAEARAAAEEECALAIEQGFVFFHAESMLFQAAALTLEGLPGEALPLVQKCLDTHRPLGSRYFLSFRVASLDQATTLAGRLENAHQALDEALGFVEMSGECFHEPELHRLMGELLFAERPNQAGQAEDCFRRAIEIARRQQARAWELRATMSWA